MTNLIVQPQSLEVTTEQYKTLKDTICKGLTASQMELHFYECKRRGVHPLDKLIVPVAFGGTYTPITTVAFMRSRALLTGEYVGHSRIEHTGKIGTDNHSAFVVVRRNVGGIVCEFPWEVDYRELVGKSDTWRKMPKAMLAKCVMAAGLRDAFDDILHGLYTWEEMDQARGDAPVTPSDQLEKLYPREPGDLEAGAREPVVVPAPPVLGATESEPTDPVVDSAEQPLTEPHEFEQAMNVIADRAGSAERRRHDIGALFKTYSEELKGWEKEDVRLLYQSKRRLLAQLSLEAKDESRVSA